MAKKWSQLSKKIEQWLLTREFLKQYLDDKKNSYLQCWHSDKVVTYEKRSQGKSLLYYPNIKGKTVYLINQTTIPIFNFPYFCKYFLNLNSVVYSSLFYLFFFIGRGLICYSAKKKNKIIITCTWKLHW